MKYIENRIVTTPTEEALALMRKCKMKDWNKFQETTIQIMEWLADAKSKGFAVGSWNLETGEKFKLYHPVLEKITV